MIKPLTQRIIKQLNSADLSLEDRAALTTALFDKLKTLPLEDAIIIEPNKITISGKELDIDQIINFKDSCIALKDNFARKVLHEQIRYLATNLGIYKAATLEDIIFYKAALWNLNQQELLLEKII